MATKTVKGRTVDEAVQKALDELNVKKDQLMYNVIEEPQKGFLGLFGGKPAVIEVRVKPKTEDVAGSFLLKTAELMGLSVTIEQQRDGKYVALNLVTSENADQGKLIGKKGQTLDSLEHLTNLVVANQDTSDTSRIRLNAGGYREKREETLRQLALRISQKAHTTKEKVVLEPMSARERKVIHTTLADSQIVTTESKGNGSKRHVVVEPVK
ncbi:MULTISPECIES: RNA-binding cell elongation regulator Jag/EloR [Bacillaceae]|uniref:RNA-binding protein KhpB n=2 Tax=Bacillaceae TaxID=186817 RepID=A0A9D5I133_9BACI|nr:MULTISPECIES: RNA-binding cell elongation regulator Jag/EloR [Bacillaceae]KQL57279.1 DNA-binding protein [Alkalicoccobacillus plakortidis]MBG9785365.1 DNA-binding protein [Shouchella lehensis]TES46810.1 protein jag [Shouchella lehensis]